MTEMAQILLKNFSQLKIQLNNFFSFNKFINSEGVNKGDWLIERPNIFANARKNNIF